VVVGLPLGQAKNNDVVEVAMPIGGYTSVNVQPTCGLASPTSLIGFLDDPLSFYEPERIQAGLVWFRSGYLEYMFPYRLPKSASLLSLQVAMEICSEAPLHNNDWPSDITLWINGKEIGTWTCSADFGAQRGVLTPTWWDTNDTQYGLLKRWLVNLDGSYIDGYKLNSLTINDLGVDQQPTIAVRIGVKSDATHVGGINLFGRGFGNYPQDLILRLEYRPHRAG
jgi:predicted transcriptional regulator